MGETFMGETFMGETFMGETFMGETFMGETFILVLSVYELLKLIEDKSSVLFTANNSILLFVTPLNLKHSNKSGILF